MKNDVERLNAICILSEVLFFKWLNKDKATKFP